MFVWLFCFFWNFVDAFMQKVLNSVKTALDFEHSCWTANFTVEDYKHETTCAGFFKHLRRSMIFHTRFLHFLRPCWDLKVVQCAPTFHVLGPWAWRCHHRGDVRKAQHTACHWSCGSLGHLSVSPCPISGHRPALHRWWSLAHQRTESEGLPCLESPRHPQSWCPGRGNALAPGHCPRQCIILWQQKEKSSKCMKEGMTWNIKEKVVWIMCNGALFPSTTVTGMDGVSVCAAVWIFKTWFRPDSWWTQPQLGEKSREKEGI